MNLLQLASDWKERLLIRPLSAKMREAADVGQRVIQERAHVKTGHMRSVSGTMFDQSNLRIIAYSDAPYSLKEELRRGHEFIGPAVNAMAGVFGGRYNYEAHFTNAAPMGAAASPESLKAREKNWKRGINLLARRKTKLVVRRWHRRYEAPWAADEVTLIR